MQDRVERLTQIGVTVTCFHLETTRWLSPFPYAENNVYEPRLYMRQLGKSRQKTVAHETYHRFLA
ncbi:MAG: hypothetical protein ETSY2_06425 [Candidatus Entotheonella gemina]|uniref:Uncharacterized protein n=1 Tax=Candidatus Entotheonella gemina TaxID=1429439 RepID=W4MDI3_9BACT|nr:MAG: hypothetical protein ETSY2_06425 [Candidatus Entotheonella gemina]